MFEQKFIDGSKPTKEYLETVSKMIQEACEAEEKIDIWTLESRG